MDIVWAILVGIVLGSVAAVTSGYATNKILAYLLRPGRPLTKAEKDPYFNREYARPKPGKTEEA